MKMRLDGMVGSAVGSRVGKVVRRAARPSLLALAALCAASGAHAEISDGVVKIGLLTDMSGAFSQFSGQGSVVAAQMAIDDCLAKECKGMKVELLTADHQNKTDIALAKAREWADVNHVDAYADMVNSAVALAMQNLAVQKGKAALFAGGPLRISNEDCQPEYAVQWMWDTYSQTAAAIKGLAKPKQSWYFITVDYAYGNAAVTEARKQLDAIGARTVAPDDVGATPSSIHAPDRPQRCWQDDDLLNLITKFLAPTKARSATTARTSPR
jgi:branched-chain amino acid transport system substrate-binding protein